MPDKYRFTLQWGNETAEKIQAGELLKTLGSRKSGIIVAALSEYVTAHPEVLPSGSLVKDVVGSCLTRVQVETLVRDMIDARLASAPPISYETGNNRSSDFAVDDDLGAMLENLECFKQ